MLDKEHQTRLICKLEFKTKRILFSREFRSSPIGGIYYPFVYTGDNIKIVPLELGGIEVLSIRIEDNNHLVDMSILNKEYKCVLSRKDNTLIYTVGFVILHL